MSLESLMRESVADNGPSPVLVQLLSFVVIGGAAAAVFVGLSAVAVALPTGLPKWLVSALCYAAFIVPVYLLHRRYSFRSEAPHGQALPRYVVVQVAGLALATGFSWLAYSLFGLANVPAALLVIGLTSGVNFVILRVWAFSGA
ncbi:MAG: GtrA family protein [Devosia nanyangense]|uniref:GtrA family protein n=1 Tax=Devosia nanyangense TaxID=1228055 RepID=A0A933L3S5_9HYPH|nr:GtrA family protein [Devosia nanyangense]